VGAYQKREEKVDKEEAGLKFLEEGCSFQPRCSHAKERCRLEEPLLLHAGEDHLVACHFFSPERN